MVEELKGEEAVVQEPRLKLLKLIQENPNN
jgi:hypothetical protein